MGMVPDLSKLTLFTDTRNVLHTAAAQFGMIGILTNILALVPATYTLTIF